MSEDALTTRFLCDLARRAALVLVKSRLETESMTGNKIIGIDLGTTNSCVAVIEGGKPVVIANSEGFRTTPSVVSYDQNAVRSVGLPAKRQAIKHPDRTIQSIKRYMGTNHRVTIDHMEFSPEQISACILQKLKAQAQAYLGERVSKAIITVPAYFDDAQRLATRHAGEIAGLEVLRVVNEPTASALAYGFNRMGQEANIVIFDFGGGTFDVTILQLSDGVLEVKSTNGNNKLGGDDFDERIIKYILDHVKAEYGTDLAGDSVVRQRLKEAAEKAKIELSGLTATQISLPFLAYADGAPINVDLNFTQAQFAELTRDLVYATAGPIGGALVDARLSADKIDHVVLVGGTTRIPSVQQFIRSFFNSEPVKSVNPDEAVAMGAAIQGGIISGEITDVLLLDVIPLTLGYEDAQGKFVKVVHRNSTIPSSQTRAFKTTRDDQTSLSIHVLQGESVECDQNTSLARFDIDNIPPGPAGSQSIEVSFDVDADGIFNCSVSHAGGKAKRVILKRTTGYNQDQIEILKRDEETRAQRELEEANRVAAVVLAESSISDAERLLSKAGAEAPQDEVEQVRTLTGALKEAVNNASLNEIEMLRSKLEVGVNNFRRAAIKSAS
jgi:molecular chaperone DnaK